MTLPSQITVSPGHPLHGSYTLPGDKSLSHRSALLAALAGGHSTIANFLIAGVTRVMLDALADLGIEWWLEGTTLHVNSPGAAAWQPPTHPLDCGSSATTLRLLAGALAAVGVPAVLDGSSGLRQRPMSRIVAPLCQMGVPIQASDSGTAPLTLIGRAHSQRLQPLDYSLPVASAQVKSCLLLAALSASGPTTLSEPGPSRDHTERMLKAMNVDVSSSQQNGLFITRLTPPARLALPPLNLTLPGDISSAAFLIVAALITPASEITLYNVGLNPTRTGLLEVLLRMGAQIEIQPKDEQGGELVGDLTVHHSQLHGTAVSGNTIVRMIDEFPAFALAAAFAHGETLVSDAQELRYKESDRISSLVRELCNLKLPVRETQDGFVIQGGKLPQAGRVDTHHDHRLGMALALAGLAGAGPVTVTGADVIAESFPEFPRVLQDLGADLQLSGDQ